MYIFRPETGQYDSYAYSYLADAQVFKGVAKSEIILTYTGNPGDAKVRVTIEDLPVLKFDVELYGIPYNPDVGHEVTVNFEGPEIHNYGVFYTDSNGLEMQERILNYRPTWELALTQNQNITANYYPIQTGIAIRDPASNMQLTVMNSRSQGGSVIKDGRIELMQNRRLNLDDWRGMGEPLNETDANGNGISVPATYFVQIFDRSQRSSLQRVIQQRQDAPAYYFFAFDAEVSTEPVFASLSVQVGLEEVMKNNGFNEEMKLELFTMGKNKILMRVENIGDLFDTEVLKYTKVDLYSLAEDLFVLANLGQASAQNIDITEMSITANQPYAEMASKKVQWKTLDDSTITPPGQGPADEVSDDSHVVYLQQQRIRVFEVEYTPAE